MFTAKTYNLIFEENDIAKVISITSDKTFGGSTINLSWFIKSSSLPPTSFLPIILSTTEFGAIGINNTENDITGEVVLIQSESNKEITINVILKKKSVVYSVSFFMDNSSQNIVEYPSNKFNNNHSGDYWNNGEYYYAIVNPSASSISISWDPSKVYPTNYNPVQIEFTFKINIGKTNYDLTKKIAIFFNNYNN